MLRAGAAAVDISPTQYPVIANGFTTQRSCDRSYDRIYARSLVLDDGQVRIALVVVDNLMMPRDLLDRAKQLASDATGIPTERMMISATHAHSTPSAMHCLGSSADPHYPEFLQRQIIRSIVLANQQLAPARIGWSVVEDPQHTFCRRWFYRPDRMVKDPFGEKTVRATIGPGFQSKDHIGPSGPEDPDLTLLAVQTRDGKPLAVLGNYAMHYFEGTPAISGDFCGKFQEAFAQELALAGQDPPLVGLMSQGTSGDNTWRDYSRPAPNLSVDQFTREMAQVAAEAYRQIEFHDWTPLAMAEAELPLKRRVPSAERLEWARQVFPHELSFVPRNRPQVFAREALLLAAQPEAVLKLQAIRIGELGITAIPNEVYALTGLKLKAQSPLKTTMNIELANGAEGYIPPPEQFVFGGYTTWPAMTAGLEEQAEPKIVETVLSLLEKVAQKPRRPLTEPRSEYAAALVAAKPRAYWRLSEMSGSLAADSSGNGNDAQIGEGVAFFLPGVEGAGFAGPRRGNRAFHFAGGRLTAELPPATDEYSVSLWFWNGLPSDARPVTAQLWSRGKGDQREGLAIGGTADPATAGKLVFTANGKRYAGKTALPLRKWQQVVVARQRGRVAIYLNGSESSELTATLSAPAADSAAWFFGDGAEAGAGLEGKLDEIAVYDRALTPAEVSRQHVIAGIGQAPPAARDSDSPLLAYIEKVRQHPGAWQPLFNGKNLDGFYVLVRGQAPSADPQKVFQASDGAIHVYKDTPSGQTMPYGVIVTEQPYSNYHLRFQYKWGTKRFAPRANTVRDAGLLYHCYPGEKVWPTSVECQVQEGDTGDLLSVYTKLTSTVARETAHPEIKGHFLPAEQGGTEIAIGAPRGVRRIVKGSTQEIDGWNTVEVIAQGDRAVHLVNGHLVNACTAMQGPAEGGKSWEPLTGGQLAFQAEGAEVLYRNIEIKRLASESAAEASGQTRFDDRQPRSPEQSLAAWHVRDGYRIELVAAEPLVVDPVAIDWGADGKLWVVEMADYPLGLDGQGQPGGRVRYLEDRDGDGRYDQSTLFLDGLNFPTGIMAWRNGVLITAAPDILYAEDTDGDGRADKREVLYSGFQQGNQQLRVNGLRWGLDNWIHCASGSHRSNYGANSQIKSHRTGKQVQVGSRDFRIRPDTGAIDPESGPSQFGRNRDDWGNWFGLQNSYPAWHYVLEDRYLRRNPHYAPPDPRKLLSQANPRVYPVAPPLERFHSVDHSNRYTSACSASVYRDDLLFARNEVQHLFTCEPVHNLVQHNRLIADGVSFRLERDGEGEELDFLASEDPWCRPVMVRTGPDGALWVVDMYRYMIEHPQWLPQKGKDALRPMYRAGDDRGRIYRVVRHDKPPRRVPHLSIFSTQQLVETLEISNGPQRDLAQRLLIERGDAEAAPLLEKLLAESEAPWARLHALCTLEGLGRLDTERLRAALSDSHPAVRRHALRIAESRKGDESLVTAALALVQDPAAEVRLQLALTLGQWSHPQAARALAQLLLSEPNSAYLTAAVMSSLDKNNIVGVLRAVQHAAASGQESAEQPLAALLQQALAWGHTEALGEVFASASTAAEYKPWQFTALAESLGRIPPARRTKLLDDVPSLRPIVKAASQTALNNKQPPAARRAAAGLLFLNPQRRAGDVEVAAELLAPQTPLEVQIAVAERLTSQNDAELYALLLAGWTSYSPTLQTEILMALAERKQGAKLLLARLEQGDIQASAITPVVRERLLAHPDAALRAKLAQQLETATSADRRQVLVRYASALSLPGNAERGQQLFRTHCAACHALGGVGGQVGPNLDSLTDRSAPAMLEAIFDPNRSVEARYMSYAAITSDGRVRTGRIDVETGSSITLVRADGKAEVLLRHEIDELRATGKSLMPEGLEKDLSPQDVADLLALVARQSPKPTE